MDQIVNTDLRRDLLKYGAKDWNECFHCGNCTAICPLTEQGFLFPRKAIRQVQLGLKEDISSNVDPWLCYYCGECTETCPRDANPGELMMSLRRYLTSLYDWTGLSRKFYKSKLWEVTFVGFFFLLVIALFAIFLPPVRDIFNNPQAYVNNQGGVMINSIIRGLNPEQFISVIEYADWTMGAIVAFLLITNILNMFYKVIIRNPQVKVPFIKYFTEFWGLIYNFAFQPKFSKCEDKTYWGGHFLLMSGYTIMFILIMVLLPKFQTEEIYNWYNWQRILGYYATFGILFFLIISTIGRIRKKDLKFKFSHVSDWLFIVMLGLTTITGILVHIFRVTGLPAATYYTYVIHMAILVPMIMIEVPFSKWSHLAYRPFAVYFARLKKASLSRQYKPETAFAA